MPGERLNYEVGDIVKLKKPHPCGSSEWEILRVGADFRLKCTGCGELIHLDCGLVKEFEAHMTSHHGFSIDHLKTIIYGTCANCVNKKEIKHETTI